MKTDKEKYIPSSDAQRWRRVLLSWYAQHKRELPWRDIEDPYKIWISEIILQQTRIVQGMDYYLRFIHRFPTVNDLAEASEDDVLQMWQGLGYYSRARNLHAAAQQIVDNGTFPSTYDTIHQLKGVGDYTAAAIASFAFGEAKATVDGNVYRVISRYFGIEEPIDTTQGKKLFAQVAQELLAVDEPAAYNQALMDFGAMQCVPRSPRCEDCPLVASCVGLRLDIVEDLPVKAKKLEVKNRYFVYLYLIAQKQIWLHRREKGDIWQGLYEPYLLEFDHMPEWNEIVEVLKLPLSAIYHKVATNIKHVLTHRILWADAYVVKLESPISLDKKGIWIAEREREDYAVPRLVELVYHQIDKQSREKTPNLFDCIEDNI